MREHSTRPNQAQALSASQHAGQAAGMGVGQDSLESLLQQHARLVQDLCLQALGPTDGQDAAQETLTKIVVQFAKFEPEKGSFRHWLLAVARNVCRDRLRRRGLERTLFEAERDDELDTPEASIVEPPMELWLDGRRLLKTMELLPINARVALTMFYLHGASYEELSSFFGVPPATVATWVFRARKRLRELLAAPALEQGPTLRVAVSGVQP